MGLRRQPLHLPEKLKFLLFLPPFLACGVLLAQAPTQIISAGYSVPSSIKVAPGQVITLFLRASAKSPAQPVIAPETQLPTTLAGYSVTMRQTFSDPIAVPIASVYTIQQCVGDVPSACRNLTAVSVQIPFELVPNVPRSRRPENFATLVVSEDGIPGEPIALDPATDNIHVLNSCDSTTPSATAPCLSVARHADGTLVSESTPAQPGELISIYVYGLGETTPSVNSGIKAPLPTSIPDVKVGFDFRINASPTRPVAAADAPPGNVPARSPAFAFLGSEAVGLYTVAFQVPAIPAGTPACSSTVTSNLTVNIARLASFDGAAICVKVEP
jgi:uncharacterized protein (TIGR03437 family)